VTQQPWQQEKVDERSAWEKFQDAPKPAMAQVVIVLSFTTIITLMLATFWVVVQVSQKRLFALRVDV
jgi:nicotinic acid phosphoribosyltransferase